MTNQQSTDREGLLERLNKAFTPSEELQRLLDIPDKIKEAALKVDMYFREQAIDSFKLFGLCSTEFLEQHTEKKVLEGKIDVLEQYLLWRDEQDNATDKEIYDGMVNHRLYILEKLKELKSKNV